MKAVVAAFNQEKALVGAFSVITNLQMQFGCNFLKHYPILLSDWQAGVRGLGARDPVPGAPGGELLLLPGAADQGQEEDLAETSTTSRQQ